MRNMDRGAIIAIAVVVLLVFLVALAAAFFITDLNLPEWNWNFGDLFNVRRDVADDTDPDMDDNFREELDEIIPSPSPEPGGVTPGPPVDGVVFSIDGFVHTAFVQGDWIYYADIDFGWPDQSIVVERITSGGVMGQSVHIPWEEQGWPLIIDFDVTPAGDIRLLV
ncbi:MAG: hypothetical protein FWC72_02710, partial [Oscillospiraceae bacterium]|nr:hypothetical protein [Oscillospiraceae bacterium]